MNLQYISDNKGKTTGVYIPIEDWEYLKNKFGGLKEVEYMLEVPDWHKDIVRQRLKDYNDNPDSVLNWDQAKDNFRLDSSITKSKSYRQPLTIYRKVSGGITPVRKV